jgi:quaternary ammonium compound-resistance protein SugE
MKLPLLLSFVVAVAGLSTAHAEVTVKTEQLNPADPAWKFKTLPGPPWILFAIVCMGISRALLLLAQRTIPMGTAYAVWTGIGAVGTFAVGIAAFGDAASSLRIAAAALIVAGVVGLKFA